MRTETRNGLPGGWRALVRRLVALAFALALAGCASVQYRDAKPESPRDGAVVIRMLPNVQSSSQFFKNWLALKVARAPQAGESAEVEYMISPWLNAASRSAVYAGALPAGEYRFVQFSAMQCGAICISAWLNVGPRFSRFVVQPGQITDLGVLVQTEGGSGSKDALLTHSAPGESALAAEFVREYLPDLVPMLQRPMISWRADSVPAGMAAMHQLSVQRSYGFADPHEDSDGGFVYGSANGVLGRWKPDGTRQRFDIGERVAVDAVLTTSDGAWLAAGEYSVIKISRDQGRSWSSLRGGLPLGLVVGLQQWQDKIVLTLLRGKEVQIHMAPMGTDQWEMLARHTMDVNWFFDVQGVRPQSMLVGDMLVTTVPGRQLAVLDLQTGKSDLRKLPGAVQLFSASADGVLRCRCISTLKVDPYESRDLGRTWEESTASRFMLMPAFRDKLNGVAFKGGFMSASKFAYTSDGGKTWTETAEAPLYFQQLFYSKDGRKAFAASLTGALWETDDDGRNWRSIR